MTTSTVFTSNQADRPPAELHFPEVDMRMPGMEHVIAPAERTWDSFFLQEQTVSDDFLPEHEAQKPPCGTTSSIPTSSAM